MYGSVVAERYASALFEVAKRKGFEDEINNNLGLVKGLFEDLAFRRLLLSPRIRIEKKMESLGRGLEGVVNPLIMSLLGLLLDRKRVGHFPEIAGVYTLMLEDARGIARAKVRTAIPLDEATEKRLMEVLEDVTGKRILLEKIVDRTLIGGVAVRVGDNLLDSTIRTRLREMKAQLLAVKVH
jgi:F-type H+-transporting ATPase subunit delta